MNKNKEKQFEQLLIDMGNCKKCLTLCSKNGRDCSLINIYKDKNFCRNIPSIWTDWYNRLSADIMIIGQDWGPFEEMKKINKKYLDIKTEKSWKSIIEEEKSLTKKQLTNFLINSSNGKISTLDNIYITNAIMCARKNSNYRGNDINLKLSTENCGNFLKRQIEIVKPKVILTLGYYPLYSLSKIYNFLIEDNLTKTISKYPVIENGGVVIIPLYHPAAQIKKEEQLKQYYKIWDYI